MKATLSITSMNANGSGDMSSRSYGNINRDYLTYAGDGDTIPQLPGPIEEGSDTPNPMNSFMEWADAVARGVNSLSTRTYVSSQVNAGWDVNEELID